MTMMRQVWPAAVAFQILCLLLWVSPMVNASSCNSCGCEGCQPGVTMAIVRYPNPSNPSEKLQNNCLSLHELAEKPNTAFSASQCNELYKHVTRVCACYYPNGTDVQPYGAADEPDEDNVGGADSSGGSGNGSGASAGGSDNRGFGIALLDENGGTYDNAFPDTSSSNDRLRFTGFVGVLSVASFLVHAWL